MLVNTVKLNSVNNLKNIKVQNVSRLDMISFAQKRKTDEQSPHPLNLNGPILNRDILRYKALKEEVEQFAVDKSNAIFIGKGLCANAYVFKKYPDIVIKESINGKDDFASEEKNLKKAPNELEHTQRFVARIYNKRNDCYYLLSTKADGYIPDPIAAPWTKEHLKSLFDSMYIMDKHAFYHGDLNARNILLDNKGNANLIDFQYSYELPEDKWFKEKEISTTPDFIYNENALMYEQAAITEYLLDIKDSGKAKDFFRLYLSQKAQYHQNRCEFLSQATKNWQNEDELATIRKSIAFEKSRANLFKNPSDDLMKIEAKKINFLHAFRDAYAKVDGGIENKNIIPAGAYYLYTLSTIQDFRNEIQKQKEQEDIDFDTIIYLKSMEKFGDYWFDKVKSWADGAFMYPLRHANKLKYEWEGELFNFQNEKIDINKFGNVVDIAKHIDENFKPNYTKRFNYDDVGFLNPLAIIAGTTEKLKIKDADKKILQKLDEIKELNLKLVRSMRTRRLIELVNYSLLGVVRAQELDEINKQTDNIEELDEYIQTLKMQYSNFAVFSYLGAYEAIVNDDTKKGELTGYDDMGNFAIQEF